MTADKHTLLRTQKKEIQLGKESREGFPEEVSVPHDSEF